MADDDIFAQGSRKYTGPEKSYGYTVVYPKTSAGADQGVSIALLPPPPGYALVAVSYLRVPDDVPSTLVEGSSEYNAHTLPWPDSMRGLLAAAARRLITEKQGDGTTVNSLSTQEMNMLIQALA